MMDIIVDQYGKKFQYIIESEMHDIEGDDYLLEGSIVIKRGGFESHDDAQKFIDKHDLINCRVSYQYIKDKNSGD